jgi:uncharacterized protein (TIGR03437 family)
MARFGAMSGAMACLWCAAAVAQSTTVNVQILNQVNQQVGVKGRLQLAMSTSFQLAGGIYQLYGLGLLGNLYPQDTRVQVISAGLPLSAPDTWDFTDLNAMLSPIQSTGDHSPEFQIANAPAYMNGANGQILPGSYAGFAQMSANLVHYYNTGGFDDSGIHFQSPTPYPVTWWGIFNEPNGNGLTAQEYTNLYNVAATAMAQADPSVQFVALELSDFGTAAESYMPTFIANVSAPVSVIGTHFYSTCSQASTDSAVFASVPNFGSEVQYIYSELATQPGLAAVPVWVTENNVNSDYETANGMSYCNPGTKFVTDPRGTSAFFAAWRSLVFAELGEAGAQALYHWTFGGDQQYGEVDSSGNPYLSYWVDYYLSHWLGSPPGADILQVNESGCCLWIYNGGNPLGLDTHTLAVRNVDGSVVILMSNHAVQNALKDNNGTGASRTFTLDLSALGTFNSATLVTLDAGTPLSGPLFTTPAPAAQMQVTLQGYGAALLRLANTQPTLSAAGIGNAGSYTAGAVAPGELVSLFGAAIGPASPVNLVLTNPRLVANSLAGVHVLFDGVPAPVLYASAGQVNAVVPYAVAGQPSTQVQVEYLGAVSAAITVPVAATLPGVFTLDGSGVGPGAILNAANESVNSASNPAAPGDWVSIFATGAGATMPAGVDGLLATAPLSMPQAPVTVTIGGLPCQINYAGAAPGLVAGVLQVNALVPVGVAPSASVPVQVTIGGVSTQAGVTLAVQ